MFVYIFLGGGGASASTSREDKIKSIVDDIMEKLPDPFSMAEIMGKVEERTPYVVVAFQVKILFYFCENLVYFFQRKIPLFFVRSVKE